MTELERIEQLILLLRGQKVLLDSDLARLYDVPTKVLIQAVKRNQSRFPDDFLFQISEQEFHSLRSQIVTSNGRGGRRHLPFAFTEQGVAMLSSVLRSDRAIRVNIEIMRVFVRLRGLVHSHEELSRKLADLEEKYIDHDEKIQSVFQAIRSLMSPAIPKKKRHIGFRLD